MSRRRVSPASPDVRPALSAGFCISGLRISRQLTTRRGRRITRISGQLASSHESRREFRENSGNVSACALNRRSGWRYSGEYVSTGTGRASSRCELRFAIAHLQSPLLLPLRLRPNRLTQPMTFEPCFHGIQKQAVHLRILVQGIAFQSFYARRMQIKHDRGRGFLKRATCWRTPASWQWRCYWNTEAQTL